MTIKLENIDFRFPKSKDYLFKNLSLEIPKNEYIIGLVGPNGVGKTILAQILVGLRKIEKGKIIFNKNILNKIQISKRIKYISMTSQFSNSVFVKQTVEKEIAFTIQSKTRLEKISYDINTLLKSVLDRINIPKDMNPFFLSGGEKRKLQFSLLDIMDPEIYILDEPTNGFDLNQINELKNILRGLIEKKKKIIIISHDIKFLSMISNYLIVLERKVGSTFSKIKYQGSFKDLLIKEDLSNFNFLSIPIELFIYKELYKNNQIDKNLELKDFWLKNAEFKYNGEIKN